MNTAFAFLVNLFFNTMWGIFLVGLIAFASAKILKKIFPRFPNPDAIAFYAGLVAFLTFPSRSKYSFERDVLNKLDRMPWANIVYKNYKSSFYLPITWFRTPLDSIYFVQPRDPMRGHTGYQENFLKYDEDPEIFFAEPNCEDMYIYYFAPDKDGVIRYLPNQPIAMDEHHYSLYCEYDWATKEEMLRQSILKRFK